MEKEVIIKRIKGLALELITNIVCVFIICGLFIIFVFHVTGPFFPVLFLFDFCFVIGHPLFLRYVLKKKWFECTKDDYLKVKYILLPWSIMETMLMLSYYNHILFVLQKIAEN